MNDLSGDNDINFSLTNTRVDTNQSPYTNPIAADSRSELIATLTFTYDRQVNSESVSFDIGQIANPNIHPTAIGFVDDDTFTSLAVDSNTSAVSSITGTAVPEPGSLALMALCGAGIFFRRARR